MLGDNYIEINGVKLTPSTFDYQIAAVETVNQSEAGTDIVITSRLAKYTFNASWTGIDSSLLDTIEGFCLENTVTLKYKEKEYTCRARGAAPRLLGKSYKYRRSDGLWDVNLTFTQI